MMMPRANKIILLNRSRAEPGIKMLSTLLACFLAYVQPTELCVAFWNVENLFDTQDDPKVELDEEYTPTSPKQWTPERYQTKLKNLAQVIRGMDDGKGPDVLGICEVENAAVVKDLIGALDLPKRKYQLVHRDSPSNRGIDCAILVDEAVLKLESKEFHPVPDVNTREIVEARVSLNGRPLTVFMNHWPSRGSDKDGRQREKAALVLRKRVDELLKKDAAADIIIGGDLNDHVTDKSVREVLRAETDKSQLHGETLFDTVVTAKSDVGTIFFDGKWEIIDHIVVSRGLLDDQGFIWKADSTRIVANEFQLFKDKSKMRPNRTYAGDKYHGGYSDHMPVLCLIELSDK